MSGSAFRRLSLFVLVAALAVPAMAQSYNVVNTSWTVNCLFAPSCSNYVTDFTATYMGGKARLQTRINQGEAGSTAAGKWVYRYRIDMAQVVGVTYPPHSNYLAIHNFGPLLQYDYNSDGNATDHLFNVTSGGVGTKPVTQAWLAVDYFTYFYLNNPVYAGSYPGNGESSYFFGVVSDYPPVIRTVWVHTDTGWVALNGYAPQYP